MTMLFLLNLIIVRKYVKILKNYVISENKPFIDEFTRMCEPMKCIKLVSRAGN